MSMHCPKQSGGYTRMIKRPDAENRMDRTGNNKRGSNLLGVGQYNERLILQLVRHSGSLSKAEIARTTGLSAQTVSVIINRLLRDKLVRKQARQREKGKVGQPAVPISLNPDGAYSIGVKIGRRSMDTLVIDFAGNVQQRICHHYDYPDPDKVFPTVEQDIATLTGKMSAAHQSRIIGIGVCAPYILGGWQQAVDAPREVLSRWNQIDIGAEVRASQSLPVYFSNDATAACIAELEFGKGPEFDSYLYLFVGTFIGGGVVLDGTLRAGAYNNAGAVGSMLVPAIYADSTVMVEGTTVQLIYCASRYLLEARLASIGVDPEVVIEQLGNGDTKELSSEVREIFQTWLQQAAQAIAFAVSAATSVVDFEGIIIDGALPTNLVGQLATSVDQELAEINLEGLVRPKVIAGTNGSDARARGAAVLPFYSNYTPDRDVLLKLGMNVAG